MTYSQLRHLLGSGLFNAKHTNLTASATGSKSRERRNAVYKSIAPKLLNQHR